MFYFLILSISLFNKMLKLSKGGFGMKKIITTIFASLFLASGASAAVPVLKVLSAAPKGGLNEPGRQAVTIHFNEPVVALGEDSQFDTPENCPFTITPAVEGACRYAGTQTVLFEPAENWPAATQFTVTLPKGFKSQVSGRKLARAYTFSFQTQTPQIVSVWPNNNEHWISLNPTLYLLPSMPVDVNRAAQFIQLAYTVGKRKHTIPVAVRTLAPVELEKEFNYFSNEEKQRFFALSPTEPLEMGHAYTLEVLPGLPATTGNVGSAQLYTSTFYTYPTLTVHKVQSTGCLPFVPNLQLSTPVRKSEVWAHADVVPATAKQPLPEAEETSLGYEYTHPKTGEAYFTMPLSFITLEPGKEVQVTLRKGMRDIYNNVLAEDVHFAITNNGYCPAVDFTAGGFGVVESNLPARLPISLMNTPSLPVEAARFNRDNFIAFDQQEVSYCAKKPLAQTTFDGNYMFTDVKDKTQKTYIDLQKFKPTATDSIIFSQVKTRRGADKADCWLSSTDNITDLGITFKTSAEDMLVWVTSLQTGQPLAGRQVEIRNKDNQIVWTGVTDANGLARIPGWSKLNVPAARWGQPVLYAFITSPNGDGVVSNLWNEGLEPWRFNVNFDYNPTENASYAYVFTERGIYRPGERVYVKGVLRQVENGAFKLPKTLRGELSVHDGRGEEILKKDVTLSTKWGTFDTSFELPASATSGYWEIAFAPNMQGQEVQPSYASFQVETVKPADFNINLRTNQPEYTGGEEATFSAAAQYYFGTPLAGADVQWTLRRETASFTPKGYETYTFTPYFLRNEEGMQGSNLLLNASGKLDSRGALLFAAKMPVTPLPVRVYGEVEVQSAARQHLFKRTSVLVHPADLYIGARVTQEDARAGQPLDIQLVAVTPKGQPAEATVTAQIYKQQYFSVRKVGLAGRLEWVSEKKITPLPSQTVTVGKKGGTLTFTPPSAGSYFIKLTARDLLGRTVQGGIDTYVYGADYTFVRQQDDDILKLGQNKNEYKVGQKARVRVESPYPQAQALVTVEREGILDAWTTPLTSGKAYVDIPIKENYLPNVYVGITLVQGRTDKPSTQTADLGKPQGKTGYVNLNVIADKKRLDTTLKTNAQKYQPGQTVTVDITTKAGRKATPAEVVLMVVDEGILALSNYQTPDLFDYFYGSKPLSVFTMDNRAYVIGQRNFGEKGENRGGGGSSNSKLGGTDLRSRFEFTPYFAAAVHTDAKGKARTSFTLPDNLTTFRVMAVALTESEFGKAQTSLTVSKPVMATPKLPQFAREGDQFTCGIIVYNYEDAKGQFSVQAQAQGGVTLEGAATQQVSVPKGQSREVTWKCRAVRNGQATLAFMAQGHKYADGVQKTIAVSFPEKEQTLRAFGSTVYTKQEITDEPANLYAGAPNRITLGMASTALLQLKGALSYLLNYPYNCLEQQLSKITPAVFAQNLITAFDLASPATLRAQAQEVLANLPQYQQPDGGFSYWPGALPDVYVTVYALDVALAAKEAGLDVPAGVEKAIGWLENKAFLDQTALAYDYPAAQTDTLRAYAAYVLTRYGRNTDSWFNMLYAKRAQLSSTALAYLLQTAHASGKEPLVQKVLARILRARITYTPTTAYVPEKENAVWLHTNRVSATAHTLQALLAAQMKADTDFQLAAWLVSQLNAQGHWNDTHTNAMALRALQVYYEAYEAETPSFTASITQNYQTRLEGNFQGHSLKEITADITMGQVYANSSQAQFTFAKQGKGTLYYTLGQVYTPAFYETPVNAGFTVTRRITTLDGQPVTQITTGQRYKVTLHIKNAAARSFVVAEDFIPAGFALVNTHLVTESAAQAQLLNRENTAFSRVEQYDDHIAAFTDELPAGEHTFSYLVTALGTGRYIYPAAWVSQMYEPSVFGRNTTQLLNIR